MHHKLEQGGAIMQTDDPEPPHTHNFFGVCRSPNYAPEWVKCGRLTELPDNRHTFRFLATPTGSAGWEFLAVPVGEDPPPLTEQPKPKRPGQSSASAPANTATKSRPLPGEDEHEPQAFFGDGDDS
jgi:hypothetical protein